MSLLRSGFFFSFLLVANILSAQPKRVVILKVDGLNQDLLAQAMSKQDPATGRSQLPWLSKIFGENGTIFDNFYTRGISLSAPSWSMLDTGRHAIIRGNAEYDRFTGQAYDYLNFVPLYFGYGRNKQIDMPGVEVLDRAGIPLMIDRFPYADTYQGFQLFQRGVRWSTLIQLLKRRFSSKALVSTFEGSAPSYDSLLAKQTESELLAALSQQNVLYLDFFTGDVDHQGHASTEPEAILNQLRIVDALAGRLWTAIQKSPLPLQTVLVVVSDHGMNNVPGIVSQTYSLPDFLNSPAGGAHHVLSNRQELSDFKLKALNPLVSRVFTPSTESFYLPDQASHYPTAWLDMDGNERASVQFRNSDLNKIHILLLQLTRPDLAPPLRLAAAACLTEIIDRHRASWSATVSDLDAELQQLSKAIAERKILVGKQPKMFKREQYESGEARVSHRLRQVLDDWQEEFTAYTSYSAHVKNLLAFVPDTTHPLRAKISELIPELSLGEPNSAADIQHYAVGPAATGLALTSAGRLDEELSFRYLNYPALFLAQRARNLPQPELSAHPVDFVAARLPDQDGHHRYWLYGGDESQLVILTDSAGRINVKPLNQPWRANLPLHLFEDPALNIPAGVDRAAWLSAWHTEREWFEAIHLCKYSNGVIGITEELSPVGPQVPGKPGLDPVLLRYERRRRELVQPELEIFAADHWNFNVRFPNPGGNHGSFLRISTHSVWMMAGGGLSARHNSEPQDSLDFAPALLNLIGVPTGLSP